MTTKTNKVHFEAERLHSDKICRLNHEICSHQGIYNKAQCYFWAFSINLNGWPPTVGPDVVIKIAQFLQKAARKVATAVFS